MGLLDDVIGAGVGAGETIVDVPADAVNATLGRDADNLGWFGEVEGLMRADPIPGFAGVAGLVPRGVDAGGFAPDMFTGDVTDSMPEVDRPSVIEQQQSGENGGGSGVSMTAILAGVGLAAVVLIGGDW